MSFVPGAEDRSVHVGHEDVSREAKALFEVSKELFGRLTTLATHVDKLGRSIERSVKDYNSFVGSLERQVLPSARSLSQLDESKVLPALPEINESTRELSSSDLNAALEPATTPSLSPSEELEVLDDLGVGRPELPTLFDAPSKRGKRASSG